MEFLLGVDSVGSSWSVRIGIWEVCDDINSTGAGSITPRVVSIGRVITVMIHRPVGMDVRLHDVKFWAEGSSNLIGIAVVHAIALTSPKRAIGILCRHLDHIECCIAVAADLT